MRREDIEAMYRFKHLRLRLVEIDENGQETGWVMASSLLYMDADADPPTVRSIPVEEVFKDGMSPDFFRRLLNEHGFKDFGPTPVGE